MFDVYAAASSQRDSSLVREPPIVLSGLHLRPATRAYKQGLTVATLSFDLGLTTQEAPLSAAGLALPDGGLLPWAAVAEMEGQETACYTVVGGQAEKITRFSELTNRAYSLMATRAAPTLIVAGFTMHRIVGVDPSQDTKLKMKALGTPRGRLLDTCTGLGYTAIAAAQTAAEVVTIELDPTTLEIARLNPWSRGLFANHRISQRVGDSFEVVQELPDGAFAAIIHDPPTFSLAGELYSGAFYRQLYRVLQRGGRVFHYIGQVEGKFSQSLQKGVLRRLADAGFQRVDRVPEAFGLVAHKTAL